MVVSPHGWINLPGGQKLAAGTPIYFTHTRTTKILEVLKLDFDTTPLQDRASNSGKKAHTTLRAPLCQ